jgi:hypothetical protein
MCNCRVSRQSRIPGDRYGICTNVDSLVRHSPLPGWLAALRSRQCPQLLTTGSCSGIPYMTCQLLHCYNLQYSIFQEIRAQIQKEPPGHSGGSQEVWLYPCYEVSIPRGQVTSKPRGQYPKRSGNIRPTRSVSQEVR